MIYFSQNLVHYREIMGYTQKQMAQELGIKLKRYQAWEERRCQPSMIHMVKICNLFEITDLLSFLTEKLFEKAA